MKDVYFYKGYIKPNTKRSFYIFKYKDETRFCIVEYGNILTDNYVDIYNGIDGEYPKCPPRFIEIDTIRMCTCFHPLHSKQSNPLFIEIVKNKKSQFTQICSKKFQGNYNEINTEKFDLLQSLTYTYFDTGKKGFYSWIGLKITDSDFYSISTIKKYFNLKNKNG